MEIASCAEDIPKVFSPGNIPAVLRAKECVMKTATTIQENAEDIYAEAQQINEDRAAQAAQEYDAPAETADTAADAE